MADASTTLEVGAIQEILVDELEKIPDMVTHIYVCGEEHALCGIHHTNDPHCRMHSDDDAVEMSVGTRFCPPCGAPVCDTCFALNT